MKAFHQYRVRTGHESVRCRRYSLGMGKKLAEDWANLLMNEKVKITLEGTREQAFIDRIFTANNFLVKANEMQEMKSALGTAAYVPRVVGQAVNAEGEAVPGGASDIAIDYVTVEHIYPLAWQNGVVTECAFDSAVTADGAAYLYLQIHKKAENGLYDIENRIFRVTNGNLSDAALADVPGFEHVPAVVHTGSARRQFVIDRLNIANNFDYALPLGIPVFANAIDTLKGVDIAYDSYINEFVLGKKRIMVKPGAAQYLNGEPVFDTSDTVYYVLPEDTKENDIIVPIDMSLRTAEHNTGIQDQLNLLSSKCGFGEAHYRFDGGNLTTATQVISENSTMFRTIKKHEIILEDALKELCRVLLRLGNTAMAAGLDENVEISIDFDDSIIEDKETDFNRDARMVQMGVMNAWEFRAKWLNEDEATAKAALPQMESLVADGV